MIRIFEIVDIEKPLAEIPTMKLKYAIGSQSGETLQT
jgi:hypothetical protein